MRPQDRGVRELHWMFLGAFLWTATRSIATEAPAPRRTLEEFWALAETQAPALTEAQPRLVAAQSRASAVWAETSLPQGELRAAVGPVPDATGTALSGETDFGSWGPAVFVDAQIFAPLFAFGALGNARKAANLGIEVEPLLSERSRRNLRIEIAQLYFGFQAAFEGEGLIDELSSRLEKASRIAEKLVRSGKSRVRRVHLARLEAARLELAARATDLRKQKLLVRSSLAWKLGEPNPDRVQWDRANLLRWSAPKKFSLPQVQEEAEKNRPEFRALQIDTQVKELLADIEGAKRLPVFGFVALGRISRAEGRADPSSPFAYDPFNETTGFVGLGLRWSFDWVKTQSKFRQARADAKVGQIRNAAFTSGLRLETEKAWRDWDAAVAIYPQREKAEEILKKALVDELIGIESGAFQPDKDILDLVLSYALAQQSRIESLLALNVAEVRLWEFVRPQGQVANSSPGAVDK